jgi:SAM-dependent methyltransferase
MTSPNDQQAEFWSTLAPTWIEIEDQLEQVSGRPGQMAMDRLDLQAGQTVVDLGCGTGRTTLELARRVAPGGRAIGVDIAAEMLIRGRDHAAEAGIGNAEFLHMDVQTGDLGEGRFDAAFSRFGVMFYADPVAAFAGVRRTLRRGGRLAFVCWQPITANDWMMVPGMAAVSATGTMPPMPGPDEPGPFSLSDPNRVRSILGSAGFSDIDIQPHADFIATAEDRIPEVAALAMRVGAVRELVKEVGEETRDRVRAAIEEALRSRVENGEARASRGVFVVTAAA